MARTERIRRKDLRQPDEFLSWSRRAVTWAEANRTTVMLVTGALVVLLVAVLAYRAIRASQETRAAEAYRRAHALLDDRKYPEAATAFQETANANRSTSYGILAQLQAANALLLGDRGGEAALAYQRFLDAGAPTDYLRQLALVRLGHAQEKNEKLQEAQAAYVAAAELAGPFAEEALAGEARVAEQGGDTGKAKELYSRFLTKYPESERRALVSARLIALGGTLPSPEAGTAGASAGDTAADVEAPEADAAAEAE